MQEFYDVILVGAGPTGIYASYELVKKNPSLKVLLIDQGHDIYHRHCPILEHKIEQCPMDKNQHQGCKPACSITAGFGGAGAYSDGKFNITNEFGGWLDSYLSSTDLLNLIRYVDSINLLHGAPEELTNPYTAKIKEIEKRGMAVGLKLLRSQVRHLGTEVNLKVLANIYEELRGKMDFLFETSVKDIIVEDNTIKGVLIENNQKIYASHVVLGIGRSGSGWLNSTLSRYGIAFKNHRVDVGVRVETNNIIMDEINENLYEGKFIYSTSVGTQVRTFCSNPSGHVVVENQDGIIVCNGHAYNDEKLGSDNTNFALLVSCDFDEPFRDPNTYAKEISKLANRLADGGVIVQKYGDILKGRRSTPKRIAEGFVHPTLPEAVPGDLSLVLPYKTMQSLIEMIQALDHVTPGIANDHTLFYGVEAKFYSDQIEVNKNLETKIKGLYAGGDGAGITRGLAQSSASGVHIARAILMEYLNKNN
jgi:uncharacterized FAD-dependent dehydrogenase